ncbi:arylsulfatase B-like isoform X3 [Sitodiplosis mosellana]|nr:arylsulfatase B-like isoform X3 [Sitodiplosis mosellana]XP_055304427.1 arylsulfatase B-like isoform X3 [Sitodiplosis mosellana]XP_055304435.1 arylsulfatase B-like isoform X3 [Sitodiplosis mosellana]XP_055304443.1 arylsulfatase B-like isoform X3 [Sitodiplosis mosellana]
MILRKKLNANLLVCYNFALLFAVCSAQNNGAHRIKGNRPNIIIIMADDMGFNDASIHGSNQIPTPNIDALGIMGIQLNQMYVAPMCTPSRSSLLTGKYESNLGMQHFVIPSDAPYGLSPEDKTIAQYMKIGGYRTYLVGKWHLGFFEKRYTPLYRGFDSHFGYLGPYIDYYNHSLKMAPKPDYQLASGYDMRKNLTVHWDTIKQYATDLFTDQAIETIKNHDRSAPMFMMLTHLAPHTANEDDPMQAPEDEINKFSYIQNRKRRVYAAMVSKLDQSVGKVVKALDDNKMLDNSIILFMSDNGSPIQGEHSNSGSNFPFKGQKDTPWEGAIRSAAAIWSPRLKRRQRVSNQMIHISDWLPTFAKIAGVDIDGPIDGKNVWNALSYNLPSPRREILAHHDTEVPYMAYISDNFKLVTGSTYEGLYDRWLSEPIRRSEENSTFEESYSESILASDVGQVLLKYSTTKQNQFRNWVGTNFGTISDDEIVEIRQKAKVTCNGYTPPNNNSVWACNPIESPCLFDIFSDPCETTNLASKFPDLVKKFQSKLDYYGQIARPTRNKPGDPRSDPANFGGIWTWWYDEMNITTSSSASDIGENSVHTIIYIYICFSLSFVFIRGEAFCINTQIFVRYEVQ